MSFQTQKSVYFVLFLLKSYMTESYSLSEVWNYVQSSETLQRSAKTKLFFVQIQKILKVVYSCTSTAAKKSDNVRCVGVKQFPPFLFSRRNLTIYIAVESLSWTGQYKEFPMLIYTHLYIYTYIYVHISVHIYVHYTYWYIYT